MILLLINRELTQYIDFILKQEIFIGRYFLRTQKIKFFIGLKICWFEIYK